MNKRQLMAVFVLGVVVRSVTAVVVLGSDIVDYGGGDGDGYHSLAVAVSHGHPLGPQLFEARPPGLPWITGLTYWVTGTTSPWVLVIISVLAASAVAPLGALLAAELGFDRRRQWAVAVVLAVEPTLVWVGIAPLADAALAAAVTGAVLAALRLSRTPRVVTAAALGGLLALAVLVKPAALLLWTLPVLALLFRKQLKLAAIVGVVAVLPIVGWTVRNISDAGIPTYSTASGYGLLFHRAVGIEHRVRGVPADVVRDEYERDLAEQLHLSTVEPHTYYFAPPDNRTYEAVRTKALAVIRKYPTRYALATPVGAWRMATSFEMVTGPAATGFTIYYVFLYALAGLGWIRCVRSRPAYGFAALGIVLYFAFVLLSQITAGFGGTRQAVPFLPVIYLLAAWPDLAGWGG